MLEQMLYKLPHYPRSSKFCTYQEAENLNDFSFNLANNVEFTYTG